jgi:hypothetical protein
VSLAFALGSDVKKMQREYYNQDFMYYDEVYDKRRGGFKRRCGIKEKKK